MRLKVALGCLLALMLVFSPTLAGDKAENPPPDDHKACQQGASDDGSDCCGRHQQRGGGKGQAGAGKGHGGGPGEGCCGKGMGGEGFDEDHALFHYLLDHRGEIRRDVQMRDDGVETVTESSDPEVAEKIRQHVASMYERIEEGRPIHRRDPLFAELFRHTDKIRMKVKETKKGVRVIETSDDPEVAALIQAHAEVVSLFLENGHAEMHRNHALPGQTATENDGGGCPHRARMAGGE